MTTDSRRRALIDTDPGIDDALALLLAWGSPEWTVDVVTVVAGNVPLEAFKAPGQGAEVPFETARMTVTQLTLVFDSVASTLTSRLPGNSDSRTIKPAIGLEVAGSRLTT